MHEAASRSPALFAGRPFDPSAGGAACPVPKPGSGRGNLKEEGFVKQLGLAVVLSVLVVGGAACGKSNRKSAYHPPAATAPTPAAGGNADQQEDRKSTRLNSSHVSI